MHIQHLYSDDANSDSTVPYGVTVVHITVGTVT